MIKVLGNGVRARGWRGIVFARTPVAQRDGKLKTMPVVGFCTSYEAKDGVKQFVGKYGGSWNAAERFWYIPLPEGKVGEVLDKFFEISNSAIAEFGDHLKLGDGNIQVSVEPEFPNKGKAVAYLQKKFRLSLSHLQVVESPVVPLPVVRGISRQTQEDEFGRVAFVRYLAKVGGEEEFVYPFPPEGDLMLEVKSGKDATGRTWWWLEGERAFSLSFKPYGEKGGWFPAAKEESLEAH